MSDDWLEDEVDDQSYELEQRNRNWKRLRETFLVQGFRDHMDVSRDANLQTGFDQGFVEAFKFSMPLAKLTGAVR
jgi:hypothetical protein